MMKIKKKNKMVLIKSSTANPDKFTVNEMTMKDMGNFGMHAFSTIGYCDGATKVEDGVFLEMPKISVSGAIIRTGKVDDANINENFYMMAEINMKNPDHKKFYDIMKSLYLKGGERIIEFCDKVERSPKKPNASNPNLYIPRGKMEPDFESWTYQNVNAYKFPIGNKDRDFNGDQDEKIMFIQIDYYHYEGKLIKATFVGPDLQEISWDLLKMATTDTLIPTIKIRQVKMVNVVRFHISVTSGVVLGKLEPVKKNSQYAETIEEEKKNNPELLKNYIKSFNELSKELPIKDAELKEPIIDSVTDLTNDFDKIVSGTVEKKPKSVNISNGPTRKPPVKQ